METEGLAALKSPKRGPKLNAKLEIKHDGQSLIRENLIDKTPGQY